DPVLAYKRIPQRELGLDLVIDGPRDAQASSLGQALQTGGNIDSIPIDPLPLYHHIPQVEAQAKLHSTVDRERCVPGCELPLDSDRTLHRIHHTDKLCQQVITREVHNATSVLLNEGGHDLPIGHQGTDSRL